MMRNISLLIVLFCILGVMSGCSTSGSLNVHESVTDEPIQGKTVDLKVVPSNAAWNQVAFRLKGAVLTQLLGAGLFKEVSDEDANYKITIKLTEVREVSGVSRVMLGVFAGSNQIW